MPHKTPEHYFSVAKKHLEKVQAAWDDPTDWVDLTTYGLYCLEACVVAASIIKGLDLSHHKKHWGKANLAKKLHKDHGLPDIADLMNELNDARKANAYGDEDFKKEDFDAEQLASDIENYVNEVAPLLP